MVDIPKTSFIPKQSMGSVPGRAPVRRRHFNVFSFVGMVIFLCGMILAVGVFIYKDLAKKDLASKQEQLQEEKSSFSQGDILSLRALDRRLGVARALLDQHLSPSVVFDTLEERTQSDVQFTEFSYTRRESGSVELTFDGKAVRFNTVGLQSEQLSNAPALASVIFSDLNIDVEDNVNFTITGEADTAEITYSVIDSFEVPEDLPPVDLNATSSEETLDVSAGTEPAVTPDTSASTQSPVDAQDVEALENELNNGF